MSNSPNKKENVNAAGEPLQTPIPPARYLDLPEQDEILLPEMKIAYLRHEINNKDKYDVPDLESKREALMKYIVDNKMHYIYEEYKSDLGLPDIPDNDLKAWKDDEIEELSQIENAIVYCKESMGNSDVRDQVLHKAHYLCGIGCMPKAIEIYKEALEKSVGTSGKLHILLTLIRIGMFVSDNDMVKDNIQLSKQILERGGDWERRNKLKVYEGLYFMSQRKFKEASDLLLEGISTFTASEIIDFESFITYCITLSFICQSRQVYKKSILNSPEVMQVTSNDPVLKAYTHSFYNGFYDKGMSALLGVADRFKRDYFLWEHWCLYVRKVRIYVYSTFLEPFQNVKISYMAKTFGVSDEFMETEVSQMIGSGLISSRIDLIDRIIYKNATVEEDTLMEKVFEEGENLVSKLQKLSAVIYL